MLTYIGIIDFSKIPFLSVSLSVTTSKFHAQMLNGLLTIYAGFVVFYTTISYLFYLVIFYIVTKQKISILCTDLSI